MKNWLISPSKRFAGNLTVAGDKSISHRAIMFGALAEGTTHIHGFLEGEDCLATMRAFQAMGVSIEHHGEGEVTVHGVGLRGLRAPEHELDVGNSGTSMRLMAGILAGQAFSSTLVGDHSLMKRPMKRVALPLKQMGANIEISENGTAPIVLHPSALQGLDYTLPVASAQLKSALLLAGLYAEGETRITETGISRDHSERMLKAFGVEIRQEDKALCIRGGQTLHACDLTVPADISSAAFFIVAALIAPEGEVLLPNVGINPTRAAIITLLQMMNGDITLENERLAGAEPVADIRVRASRLRGIDVPVELVPIAIDEFPILFIAAACAEGITRASALEELRVKESDRLSTMEQGLIALGVACETTHDSITIYGKNGVAFTGGTIDSKSDHRIAMSFAIASLRACAPILVKDCENVATSFPTFRHLAQQAGLMIEDWA
ncbi:MAG: 3-phosphoshikimate 1-carboxyvinyltransferase [Cardiobacteriaceae bacterium]|nr:3-phosphoshikimate 1-carboxyvinyltransferase [Cardiobacteriaceae bacterium]